MNPTSNYQNVRRYLNSSLGYLQNTSVLFRTDSRLLNLDLKNFNKTATGNLGDTTTFKRNLRSRAQNSLVVTQQGIEQLVQTLSVTNQTSADFTYTDEAEIFNIDPNNILPQTHQSRLAEIATDLETRLFAQFTADFRVNNANSPDNGELVDPNSGPYRFFANGWQINQDTIPVWSDITELSSAQQAFRIYGFSPTNPVVILPAEAQPKLAGNAFNQFVLKRNESWGFTYEIGDYAGFRFFTSALLHTHISGSVGNSTNVLSVVSTNESNGIITEITFSGATPNDPNAIKASDRIQFSQLNSFSFLRYTGHQLAAQLPVQVRSIADIPSDGAGNVTIPIFPALNFNSSSPQQNIPFSIPIGQQAGVLPNYVGGIIMSGDPFYFANPRLGKTTPWPSEFLSPELDEDNLTVLDLRHYYGYQRPGTNSHSSIIDGVYGSALVPENCMTLVFPANGQLYP